MKFEASGYGDARMFAGWMGEVQMGASRIESAKIDGDEALTIGYEHLTNLELGGGRTQRGGGGGFGLDGFAIGAMTAGLLNALTTSVRVATIVGIQWKGGEIIVVYSGEEPDRLRIRLLPVFWRDARS